MSRPSVCTVVCMATLARVQYGARRTSFEVRGLFREGRRSTVSERPGSRSRFPLARRTRRAAVCPCRSAGPARTDYRLPSTARRGGLWSAARASAWLDKKATVGIFDSGLHQTSIPIFVHRLPART